MVQEVPPGSSAPSVVSLFGQSFANIWENEAGDFVDALTIDFTFGEEPVLKTGEQSTLWLTPV